MHTARTVSHAKGFTLIEVLVVIGIIAILAGVVLVALNPARQFAEARNSQRTSNVTTLLDAMGQRTVDNKGVFAGDFTVDSKSYTCPALNAGTAYDITSASGSGNVDLACLTPTYIPSALPVDPSATGAHWGSDTDYDTKYSITVDSSGRYTVSASSSELGQSISLTR